MGQINNMYFLIYAERKDIIPVTFFSKMYNVNIIRRNHQTNQIERQDAK